MISRLTDIKYGIIIRSLTRAGQHCGNAALELADLRCHVVICRILQSRIEISGILKVKKLSHLLGSLILKGGTLIDRKHSGLALFRLPSGLNANCVKLILISHVYPPSQLAFSLCTMSYE